MAQFPSMGGKPSMLAALGLNAPAGRLLVDYHTVVMRGESPLTPGQRETIAAFVSGLNACVYCHGVHAATAQAFGMDEGLLSSLVNDPELNAADAAMRPILRYARKLTLDQTKITESDAEAVYAAGWSERALHDAICVAALFNFMNRFVHGHGLSADASDLTASGARLMAHGYAPLLDALGGDRTRA